jgi:hypothetical protein
MEKGLNSLKDAHERTRRLLVFAPKAREKDSLEDARPRKNQLSVFDKLHKVEQHGDKHRGHCTQQESLVRIRGLDLVHEGLCTSSIITRFDEQVKDKEDKQSNFLIKKM